MHLLSTLKFFLVTCYQDELSLKLKEALLKREVLINVRHSFSQTQIS